MKGEHYRSSIVVADAQYLTCTALESTLQEFYSVTAVFHSSAGLIEWMENGKADLMILDPVLLDVELSSVLEKLKTKVPRIMILTNEVSHADFKELNSAGIETIVLKSAGRDELLHAVDMTLKGKRHYSEEVLQLIVEQGSRDKPTQKAGHLTSSEMEIVRLIAEGLTTKEIAGKKNISFHTVMTHRKNIFRKTGVNSVSELIMYAIKAGWIDNIEYYI